MFRYKSKYKKVGVLPIWKVKSNVSSVGASSDRHMTNAEGPTLETLDFTFRIVIGHIEKLNESARD